MAGVFALDQKKNIVAKSLFPKDPEKIVERMENLAKGTVTEELDEVLCEIKDHDVVSDINFQREGFNVDFREKTSASDYLKENIREIAVQTGFADSSEINALISDIQILKTKKKMRTEKKKDRIAMQAVSCVEDLVGITNLMSERLHEWYGFYYPELENKVKDNKKYAETLAENPKREEIRGFEGTVGMELDQADLDMLKVLGEKTGEMFEFNERVEKYLEKIMPEVAPNITTLAGPNLAELPSSTIQLLGAEKALFRFMKSNRKSAPLKYGILFLHPEVTNAPDQLKGKVARAIASELSMAAKTDFYTGEDKSQRYKEQLKKRLKEISKK